MDTETPLHEILLERERKGPNFLTYTERPKFIENIHTSSAFSSDGGKKQAILLSGPMVYEDHFTRDTIRLYRRHYPEALIILSISDDEDHEYLDDLRDDNVHVITSRKPENPGINNSENGRLLMHAGLREAKQRKLATVLRTTPIHRFYAPNLLSFLRGISETFPLKQADKQKQRIIASSYGTRRYLPFCISAMFMYGHIDDLLMYWDAVSDTRQPLSSTDTPKTVRMQLQEQAGCYFATRYLNKLGVTYKPDSIQDHWQILADRFCLLDRDMFDICWHAPTTSPLHATERRELPYAARNTQSLTFSDWLILYHTQGHHPPAPEWVLDMPWGETMKDKPAGA